MNEKLIIIYNFIKTRWFSDFSSEQALRSYQQKLLAKQFSFIRQNTRFYQDKTEFPIINKKVLMENFNELNSVGIDKEQAISFAIECERTRDFTRKLNDVTVGLSSGTSGYRGIFLVKDSERAQWAGVMLARTLPNWHFFGVRVAFFMRADSELYQTIQSRFIKFRFFDMFNDLDDNLCNLEEFRPTILVAPPSCLLTIAKWNNTKKINPIKVISVAEVLERADAELIKKAFDIDVVHQVYQCTEGFLGTTCQYGTLHINEDIVHIEREWVDEKRFVPIVTDLKRRAQPIIRYRLNDVLMQKTEPCKCGSLFLALEKIEGRQDDVFEFEGENGRVHIFPDFIRRCILFAENVTEYRVQQTKIDEIVVLGDDLSEQSKKQIVREFEQLALKYKFTIPNVVFKPYEYNSKLKLKRVERIW